MPKILVVDDEPMICYTFRRIFNSEGIEVLTAGSIQEASALFDEARPDVVILDFQLPDGTGLDFFRKIQAEDPRRPVIFITAHGTTDTAIETMKHGAFDYLIKPIDLERVQTLLHRALEAARLMHIPAVLPDEHAGDRIIGRSVVMQEMCKTIGRIAAQDVNVLILGESGTGKELVARAIYHHSHRADKPFLAINCAAIPESLVESELFGHEQGAFTGANRQRIGKFEQCDGGTLLLDEIGDMPLPVQAKMLRLLQEQHFERVGGNQTLSTEVRVLAVTNKNLERLIADGRFRQDLYYRLRIVTIHVPPLRERREDIPELAHHFLYEYDRELKLDIRSFDPTVLELFQRYDWPGNVRELQGIIKEAMLRTTGQTILPEVLPPMDNKQLAFNNDLFQNSTSLSALPREEHHDIIGQIETFLKDGQKNVYDRIIHRVERELIIRALKTTHGHQAQASDLLGINRTTLRNKLRDLGIILDKVVSDRPAEETVPPT